MGGLQQQEALRCGWGTLVREVGMKAGNHFDLGGNPNWRT